MSAADGNPSDADGFVHLRAAGVSVLLDARGPGLPSVLHWGPDLGAGVDPVALALAAVPAVANNAMDVPVPASLLPERAVAWAGRPGLLAAVLAAGGAAGAGPGGRRGC
jgi:alpha-galactosidase